jgi:hypothetical protein
LIPVKQHSEAARFPIVKLWHIYAYTRIAKEMLHCI